MEYNDCCLPPDDVLRKMKVEYQQKSQKANVLDVKKESQNKKMLITKLTTQLQDYCVFLEYLQQNFHFSLIKQKTNAMLYKTKLQIAQFEKMYGVTNEKLEYKPRSTLTSKQPLKALLFQEVNLLKSLLNLQTLEKESGCVNCLNQMIHNRLNNLHQIISLLN